METLRGKKKKKEEILEVKYAATEMKNALDGLLSRLTTAQERITE